MDLSNIKTGLRVVRSKGDYVVGREGVVVALDAEKNRAQVEWDSAPKTWVSLTALEDASIPYTISEWSMDKRTGRQSYPKYSRK